MRGHAMAGKRSFGVRRVVQAPADVVYGIIADYHDGHGRILPRPPFTGLSVEQGGTGAGTVIRVDMRVLGQAQTFRAAISEPEPGRVLVEANDTGYTTTFTVEPRADGHSDVSIETEPPQRGGLRMALQRRLVKRLMLPVFERELQQLEAVALEAARERRGPVEQG
jgi:hypothetical protein